MTARPRRGARGSSARPAIAGLALLGAVGVVGGGLLQTTAHRGGESAGSRPLDLLPPSPGYLRVLATPWAEVWIDGQLVDVTPFARPIALPEGIHYVTLVHPSAPIEKRTVTIVRGETRTIDAVMTVPQLAPAEDAVPQEASADKASPQGDPVMTRRSVTLTLIAFAATAPAREARGFTHIVKPGETLAQIADRLYGESRLEVVLVGANALDVQGGTVIAPGMRLEVPAPGHHTVMQGETWAELSAAWLGMGDVARAELLARVNKGVSWVPPVEGQEIEVPAIVTYIAGDGETINGVAARFWGDANKGWELNRYNHRDGVPVRRGGIVLVPMTSLRLTEVGSKRGAICGGA